MICRCGRESTAGSAPRGRRSVCTGGGGRLGRKRGMGSDGRSSMLGICRRVTRRNRSHQPVGTGPVNFSYLIEARLLTLLCTPGNQHCLSNFKAEGPSGCSHSVGTNAFLCSSRANAWNPYSTLVATRVLTKEYSRCLGGKGPTLGIPSAPMLLQHDLPE